MEKKYVVRLTEEERGQLREIVSKGSAPAHKIKHAHILLKADADGPDWPDRAIAEAFGCHARTVEGVRTRFVARSFEAALGRKKRERPPREKILDGRKEARLIALACSKPPEGCARWTLHLLADRLVELDVVESVSYRTVGRALKKMNCALTCSSTG